MRLSRRWFLASVLATAAFCLTLAADAPTFKDLQVRGEVQPGADGLTAVSKSAVVALGGSTADYFRINAEVILAPQGGPVAVVVGPSEWADPMKPAAGRVNIARDKEGISLSTTAQRFDKAGNKWVNQLPALAYHYWPDAKQRGSAAAIEPLTKAGMRPQSWHGRKLRLNAEADRTGVNVWLDGMFVRRFERTAGSQVTVSLGLAKGDILAGASTEAANAKAAASLLTPVDISYLANDTFEKPAGKSEIRVGAVPFQLLGGTKDHMSLRHAQWNEWKKDPSSYYEGYDTGPTVVGDPTMPMLRVPVAGYAAVHLLAAADDDENLSNIVTLRCGRYGGSGQVLRSDFFASVPRKADVAKQKGRGVVQTPAGPLFAVRIPLTESFAQDLSDVLEIEITKEVRLARRQPDPARFRTRPLGLPSGVRIAAITLEKAPLQFRVGSAESGHAFVKPQKPEFQVKLDNISSASQGYKLTAEAVHLDGTKTKAAEESGTVQAGKSAEVSLPLPDAALGYHDVTVTLRDIAGRPVLERKTSFAVLPPDTRKHRATSPFGTWDFNGGHFTSNNPEQTGPLYVKLGMRYAMMNDPAARAKYGLTVGNEPRAQSSDKAYRDFQEKNPDSPHVALVFHEDAISGPHIMRVPDLFTDRPPYKLNPTEEKRFQTMWDQAIAGAKAVRAFDPKSHLRFGNGTLPTKEEFYRHKFPAELFDSGGNEAGVFGRPPEAQPPDCVANNATIWMDRQMLDAYGYKDKPVSQCYEVIYPATNPGNLDERTQADYFVRHALHSLAWGIKEIRPGCISDVGNSYYFSNWGATGFCRRYPELSVKPAFVSFATLTRVLDGAKFVKVLPTGSESVYAMEFDLPDGRKAYPMWTLRGTRQVSVAAQGGQWMIVNDQGVETPLVRKNMGGEVQLSPSVVYAIGTGSLKVVESRAPVYTEKPTGKPAVLAALKDLADWKVEEGRNPELEFYNFLTPRRKGDFAFEPVASFEGKSGAIKVAAKPISTGKATMPMYAVLAHKDGIPVPGTPTEVGAWVNGNSGWGRLIFELTDASGQRWISLGAQQRGDSQWMTDMVPKDLLEKMPAPGVSDWNTEDVFGTSRINFDGWRYVAFPLPGNYPGEKYGWPANSQWRSDKDGVVHYPLTFRKLIVELPEKVLKVKDFEPPKQPEIYLRELTVGTGDVAPPRKSARE